MRTWPPRAFESTQLSFDIALHSTLKRIVTASGLGFGDWQWRLATLPFAFGGLGVYSAGDVLNYVFIASRLQSAALQTKLLRHVGIVAFGLTFDDALCVFNYSMEIDFLSNPNEIAAPKLMKKMADIYFTRVTKDAKSSFSLSPYQMALWRSQREDHTSDWLRVALISGLGQTMNGKTYQCVLCYRLGVPLFSVSKPCSACSKVFTGDVYGDHAVSCAGVIGIKHRHNAVCDTLVDICFRSGISTGQEVDIGLSGDDEKRYRKRGKYMAKCAAIGYGFLPFSFSSLGELETDAVTLLRRIHKFSMAQNIGAPAAIHIFNRISFSIAKGDAVTLLKRIRKFFMTQDIGSRADVYIFNRISFAIAKGVGAQSVGLQTKLLRHTGIGCSGPSFEDVLYVPLFSVSKPCLACSRVFAGNIYGDHVVSCAGIIGIKHCHNVVCDTLVDICYQSGISVGKEVDIGLDDGP
nr:hypothetical protein [Tanacetum cinerariifolium]